MTCPTKVPAEGTVIVLFRYDDYSSHPGTDLDVELTSIFTKRHIPLTVSVIPYISARDCEDPAPQAVIPLTPRKASQLRQASNDGLLDIALHGYSHQNKNTRNYSEFEGVGYEVQYAKIQAGKRFLERLMGVPITKFVPPWNTYDSNTLAALDALGFRCISPGPAGPVSHTSSLKYIPETCSLVHLKRTINSAASFPEKQKIINVVFHQFDFIEADRKRGRFRLSQFEELVSWVISQPNISVRTLEQALEEVDDLGPERFANYSSYRKSVDRIPRLFRPSISGVYLSHTKYMTIVRWMLTRGYHLAVRSPLW